MKCHHELRLTDVLCITETHLSQSEVPHNFHMEGYRVLARSRSASYGTQCLVTQKDGDGVAMYCKTHIQCDPIRQIGKVSDLEFSVLKLQSPVGALIATMYRPPTFKINAFIYNLKGLVDCLVSLGQQPIVVCGDMNKDLISKQWNAIHGLFQSRGYTSHILQQKSTHYWITFTCHSHTFAYSQVFCRLTTATTTQCTVL